MRPGLEISLYRCLGIRVFQKLVFALEKWRHRNKPGRNSNYHLYELSASRIFVHYAFLYYNALIHLVSLIITAALFTIRRLTAMPWGVPEGLLLFAVIVNIYCIMLQRYNALRLKKMQFSFSAGQKRRMAGGAEALRLHIPPRYDAGIREADLDWLSSLAEAVGRGRDFFIEESDSCRLSRLADWKEYAGLSASLVKRKEKLPDSADREREFHNATYLYSGAEERVDRLQTIFGGSMDRVLSPCCLVTCGPGCERAFKRLFPSDRPESILETAGAFLQTQG